MQEGTRRGIGDRQKSGKRGRFSNQCKENRRNEPSSLFLGKEEGVSEDQLYGKGARAVSTSVSHCKHLGARERKGISQPQEPWPDKGENRPDKEGWGKKKRRASGLRAAWKKHHEL